MAARTTVSRVDEARALSTFLELVRIDSPTGEEAAVAGHLSAALSRAGVAVRRDPAGNIIGRREGRGALAPAAPMLLSAHMDTVEPGRGIQPVIAEGVIRSDGTTILGADDKAGITAILEALRATEEHALDCRPVEVLFTVEEEQGLHGSKALGAGELVSRQAVVLDSSSPVGTIVTRAPASDKIRVVVHGKAAHAGVSPELGIDALQAAARALASMRLGRIDDETTANVGVISGGTATNVVPERVELKGEARSRSEAKLQAQVDHMAERFHAAAAEVGATAELEIERSYAAINLDESSPLVQLVSSAIRSCGLTPELVPTGGGSDANILNGLGIPAANLGVGYVNPHSVEEQIAVADLVSACAVVLAVITHPE